MYLRLSVCQILVKVLLRLPSFDVRDWGLFVLFGRRVVRTVGIAFRAVRLVIIGLVTLSDKCFLSFWLLHSSHRNRTHAIHLLHLLVLLILLELRLFFYFVFYFLVLVVIFFKLWVIWDLIFGWIKIARIVCSRREALSTKIGPLLWYELLGRVKHCRSNGLFYFGREIVLLQVRLWKQSIRHASLAVLLSVKNEFIKAGNRTSLIVRTAGDAFLLLLLLLISHLRWIRTRMSLLSRINCSLEVWIIIVCHNNSSSYEIIKFFDNEAIKVLLEIWIKRYENLIKRTLKHLTK